MFESIHPYVNCFICTKLLSSISSFCLNSVYIKDDVFYTLHYKFFLLNNVLEDLSEAEVFLLI